MGGCGVLGGTFTLFVQGMLMVISVSALAFKFRRDSGGRTFPAFALDSSKQLAGAGWVHCANMLTALILGRVEASGSDACTWYWIEIMTDTTFGVLVELLILQAVTFGLQKCLGSAASSCFDGNYFEDSGGSHRFLPGTYCKQLAVWLFVVTCMKFCMVALMLKSKSVLVPIASFVLKPVLEDPNLKLMVVMILTPAVMNSVQFWLQDNIFLKFKGHGAPGQEPLLAAPAPIRESVA
mmetsp:Transcript_57246/g.183958  ORF Transcript_57246/g.183958 Transcript_57246/m.183958 type:complete len:237 (+) Transcript_57246:107-817(+)